ncbi:MAG TPA: hypothetical protein VH857_02845, partial [Actinomycetes bacterium]|nr:hypothetical protein [Actinomycetes bacterium]
MRSIIRKTAACLLAAGILSATAPAVSDAAPPAQGPGGPILVVANGADPFGRYYAEILQAEGLDEYAVADVSALDATTLASYRVVVLAQTALTDGQLSALTAWVNGGGDLIAMHPNAQLAGLLGLGGDTGNVSDGYVGVDTSTAPGNGITGTTMQFHGDADVWSGGTARRVATLFSGPASSANAPAVTLRSVGSGQAAAFTYDLARSVVYTRQGNPAWEGQKRDGQIDPIRSDDLFFPDWVDFSRIQIPQADEQQRLLANLITEMSPTPLPRFWYFPRGLNAAVVMTGDDHGNNGTAGQFQIFEDESAPGCSVADWQCIRSTSYMYPSTPITDADVRRFQAAGFEFGLHLSTNCQNFDDASLESDWADQLPAFNASWPGASPPRTSRTHCIAWSTWTGEPEAELRHGVRLDTNYYYWPGDAWVQNRPGMFTGSGIPMRFATKDGSLIDVYQAVTQMTDESDIDIAMHIATLLDNALGSNGYYGAFTANMHTDSAPHAGAQAIVDAAVARGVPVVSAAQMLTWLDGRNNSSFGGVSYANGRLRFAVSRAPGSNGLMGMVPANAGAGGLTQLTRDGAAVPIKHRTVKGIDYLTFDAAAGSYVATYGVPDDTPPDTVITGAAIDRDTASFTLAASEAGSHFECRVDAAAFAACSNPAKYAGLTKGTHTFSARAIDGAGNVDPSPASRSFTVTQGAGGAAGSGIPVGSAGPGEGSSPDRSKPRVTLVRRTLHVSRRGTVTLGVRCPRRELLCRVN